MNKKPSLLKRMLTGLGAYLLAPAAFEKHEKEATPANDRADQIARERRIFMWPGRKAATITRQQRRAELRKGWYGYMRKRFPEAPRNERRSLARAYAAGEWKQQQAA